MDLGILKALRSSKVTAEGLSDAIIDAVQNGLLKPGDKLPSTRDIALYLAVSRTTVMKAFDSLIARGFLVTSQGAGTWVASATHVNPRAAQAEGTEAETLFPWSNLYTSFANRLSTLGAETIDSTDFDEINFGSAPTDEHLLKTWRKILLQCSENIHNLDFEANKESFGYRPLREAIAGFLRRNKGIICDADQIVLDSGVQSIVSPVFQLLVKPGDSAVCEDPGFWGAREQFESLGAHVIPIPVDKEGLNVDALSKVEGPVEWLYIASSCQEPTGVMLSEARRHKLLQWCSENQTVILEDDWDSEFHYRGESVDPLFTLDKTGRVIYYYCFWRLLYPLISVGFTVIPQQLIPLFESYKTIWDRQFTLIEHLVLTELLNTGHLEKHIRATWKEYRKQRESLIYALTREFQKNIEVILSSAGMHVVARFNPSWQSESIQEAARKAGLPIATTQPFHVQRPRQNEFMIRYAGISPDQIDQRVVRFAEMTHQNFLQ